MFEKYKDIEYREFDPLSIMSYSYPASWFLDGREIQGGKTLSDSDKQFVRKLYPPAAGAGARPKGRRAR